MTIRTKLLLLLVSLSLVPLVIVSVLFYIHADDVCVSEALNHLESVATIQSNRVEGIVEQNIERLNLVSSRTQLRLSLDSFITSPNTDDQAKMNAILLDALDSISSFQDISVLTLDGEVVASTGEARIGDDYSDNDVFMRGQTENSADTFFLSESQELSLYLSGPLYLEGELLGVVIIEAAADNFISAIRDYAGLGETGETLLAGMNEDGDAVLLTPTRFDEDAALNMTISGEEVDSPTIQALLGQEKLFTDTVDYRGEPVLAATEHIDSTGWGLVAKIDKAEALAVVTNLQSITLALVLSALMLALLSSLVLARVITRPIIKLANVATRVSKGDLAARAEVTSKDEIGALSQAWNQMMDGMVKTNSELERELVERKTVEEKYETLVEQSNDGIVITQDGLVKFANMKVVEMTGFSLEEAIGRPFIDFISSEDRPMVVENYRKRMSGEAIPNRYDMEILAKDGQSIPVEINASLIEYEGKPADMALIRDITERKKAEEALSHLNSVLRALRDINQLITRETDRENLIKESCNILVGDRGYEKAWVLLVDEDKNPCSLPAKVW